MTNKDNSENHPAHTDLTPVKDTSHQTDYDCKGGQKPSEPGRKRVYDRLLWFLLGILATVVISGVLHSLISPMFVWIEKKRDALLCPNSYWCNTHLEFVSSADAQCQIGDIGHHFRQAIDDGDIEGVDSLTQSLAARTYLCSDYHREEGRASIHLQDLAYIYSDCFEYIAKKYQKDEFRVKTGEGSRACASKIDVNSSTGMLEGAMTFRQGRVFCFPDETPIGREVEDLEIRACSRAALSKVMPAHVLPSSD